MGGTCPTRARAARRRASIATCTTSSIEEELACGTIQPSQVLEIRVPGRRESIKRRTSITFNEDVNVRKIQAISKVKGAVKEELWFQDMEYSQKRALKKYQGWDSVLMEQEMQRNLHIYDE